MEEYPPTNSHHSMPDSGSGSQLTKMGQAGLEFVEQFELESVLGKFESELLKVAAEKGR